MMKEVRFWEEVCANVWPAFEYMLYDGWLLRFTRGYSRNSNSVWPLYDGDMLPEPKVTFCEQQYAARGLSCGFRISELPGHNAIEELLTERGYVVSNPNLLMVRTSTVAPEADIIPLELDNWLETAYRLNPVDDPDMSDWERQVLKRLSLPSRFAVVMHDGKASAYGRSVQQGNVLSIEDLWTLPALRNQSLGTHLIQGLLRFGLEDGAEVACLTVNESNVGARRLYERLGFVNRYLYHYLIPKE
jgi:ribosomal protein S18 acetylase RimI-like enzyme